MIKDKKSKEPIDGKHKKPLAKKTAALSSRKSSSKTKEVSAKVKGGKKTKNIMKATPRRDYTLFKTVLDSLDLGVYVADMETYEILFVNHYTRNLFGDIVGKTCWKTLQQGQKGPCHFCTNNKLVDEKQRPTGVYVWEFFNPITERWYECRDRAIEWADGRLVRIEIATDITNRKKTEQELKASEERWQFALEGSGDGVWDWNVQTNEVFFSKRWKEMLGFKEHEIANHLDEWSKRVHPEDLDTVMADLQKHFSGESPVYSNEHKVLCKDNTYKWILDRGKVISRTEDGKPLRMVGTHTDISRRKEFETLMHIEKNIGMVLGAATNRSDALGIVMEAVMEIPYIDSGAIYTLNQADGSLHLIQHRGLRPAFVERVTHYPAESPQAQMTVSGRPSFFNHDTIPEPIQGPLREEGLLSLAAVPVRHRGEVIGVLILSSRRHKEIPLFWQNAITTLATLIGGVIGQIIDRENLEYEKNKLQTLAEFAPFGMVMIDKTGRFTYVNQTFTDLFGYTLQDVPDGRTWFRKAYPDRQYRHGVIETWLRDFDGRVAVEHNYRVFSVCCRDGSQKTIGFSTSPLESGEYIMTCLDITEQKKAEAALSESEERYRTAIEYSNDGVAITRGTTHIYVNRKYVEMYGYERPEELIGTSIIENIHPDDKARVAGYAETRQRGGQAPSNYEFKGLKRDGTIIFIEVSVATISYKGSPAILAYLRDITERKKTEEALRQSKQRYKELADLLPQTIFEIDTEGNFTFINRYAYEQFGYTDDDLKGGVTLLDVISPRDHGRMLQNFRQVLSGVSTGGSEYRAVKKDGTEFDIFAYSSPIIEQGAVTGVRGVAVDITERKRVENTLRESEEKYRNIFENSVEGIFQSTPEGRFISVNPAMARMHGYDSPEEMIGDITDIALQHYVNPEDRKVFRELLERDGSCTGFEHQLYRKDKSTIWVSTNARAVRGPDGEILYYEGTHEDITSKKMAEEAKRESEQRLSNIINLLPDATFVIDRTGTIIAWNRAIEEMTGAPAGEMLGKNNYEYALPFYGERRPILIDLVFEKQEVIERQYANVTKYGDILTAEAFIPNLRGREAYLFGKAGILYDSKGNAVGAIESIRDITDRKRSELALQESEERYRIAIESSSDGIAIMQDGKTIFANHTLQEILGAGSMEELIGKSVDAYVHPDDRQMVLANYQKRLQGENVPNRYQFRLVRVDNTVIYVEASVAIITYQCRQATLAYIRDITDQKRLEAQLLQAQKMEAIGTLAGGIAHDFNNLLMGIQGYASLMLYSMEINNPHYEKLRSIEDLVASGAELTKQLLGFARGGKYSAKTIDLNTVLEKTSAMFARTKKEITIYKKFDENLALVEADQGQIEQVLLNLYVNAWQAMPGGGELYLETMNVVLDENYVKPYTIKPGKYVKLTVTDTGTGMDPKTQERIFEPFFTTKEMGRGTGLGLASVYGIIKNHQGLINVYSEKGHGATFSIYLPASDKRRSSEQPVTRETLKGTGTILLVDDEDTILQVNSELLTMLGYKVVTAKSGQEALVIYEEQGKEIDLVILDMIMPDMGGEETFLQLKAINPAVRVILSSGYSLNGHAKSIMDQGCKAFLQKPFNINELSQKIRSVLGPGEQEG